VSGSRQEESEDGGQEGCRMESDESHRASLNYIPSCISTPPKSLAWIL
jgi:hypothetical protein